MNPELAVEERLRRLESQVRRARMWSVAMTVALGAVVFASMQAPQAKETRSDTLVARELRIVDEKGVERASLGPDLDNPSEVSLDLRARDRQKGPKARIRVGEDAAQLDLAGDGLPASIWMANSNSGASVSLVARIDPSDFGKSSVASLGASNAADGGRLTLNRAKKVQIEGIPGQTGSVPGIVLEPSLRLNAIEGVRHDKR